MADCFRHLDKHCPASSAQEKHPVIPAPAPAPAPAKAGMTWQACAGMMCFWIERSSIAAGWIPAFAGMTELVSLWGYAISESSSTCHSLDISQTNPAQTRHKPGANPAQTRHKINGWMKYPVIDCGFRFVITALMHESAQTESAGVLLISFPGNHG